MKMEQTEGFETSAFRIQTPGNYPEESIQHSEQGESLRSRKSFLLFIFLHIFVYTWNINNATAISSEEANYLLIRPN
jgi:hypothetical protein